MKLLKKVLCVCAYFDNIIKLSAHISDDKNIEDEIIKLAKEKIAESYIKYSTNVLMKGCIPGIIMVKKSDYETIFVGALNEHPVLI